MESVLNVLKRSSWRVAGGGSRMDPSGVYTVIAGLSLVVAVPMFIVSAWSYPRALKRLRDTPDKPGSRFEEGWLGTFMLMGAISGLTSLALLLTLHTSSSVVTLIFLVIVNLLIQPVALLLCWFGVTKIFWGVSGRISYGGRRVPDSEFTDIPRSQRLQIVLFSVLQGMFGLTFGGVLCLGSLGLLIRLLTE
jgi:hypothetical protein